MRSRTRSRASHRGSVVSRWKRWMAQDESQKASSDETAVLAPSGQGGERSAGARGWARLRKASGRPFWSHPKLRQGLGDDGRAGGVTRWQRTDIRGGSGGGEKAHSPSSRPAGSGSHRPLSDPARSWACEVRPPWRLAPAVHSAAAPYLLQLLAQASAPSRPSAPEGPSPDGTRNARTACWEVQSPPHPRSLSH